MKVRESERRGTHAAVTSPRCRDWKAVRYSVMCGTSTALRSTCSAPPAPPMPLEHGTKEDGKEKRERDPLVGALPAAQLCIEGNSSL